MEVIHKIGRRKKSVARVFMSEGKGNITVNKKSFSDFFDTAILQYKIQQPFNLTETKDKFDLLVTVKGGGINGQAEAIRLAISRALVEFNDEFMEAICYYAYEASSDLAAEQGSYYRHFRQPPEVIVFRRKEGPLEFLG